MSVRRGRIREGEMEPFQFATTLKNLSVHLEFVWLMNHPRCLCSRGFFFLIFREVWFFKENRAECVCRKKGVY